MKNDSFQEFTLIHPETQTEVMVDISVNTGKILDLYCYAKDIPTLYNGETEKEYKVKVTPGKNPLFVHIQRKATIFKLLLVSGYICLMNEEDGQHEEDIKIFEKALALHDISHYNCYL